MPERAEGRLRAPAPLRLRVLCPAPRRSRGLRHFLDYAQGFLGIKGRHSALRPSQIPVRYCLAGFPRLDEAPSRGQSLGSWCARTIPPCHRLHQPPERQARLRAIRPLGPLCAQRPAPAGSGPSLPAAEPPADHGSPPPKQRPSPATGDSRLTPGRHRAAGRPLASGRAEKCCENPSGTSQTRSPGHQVPLAGRAPAPPLSWLPSRLSPRQRGMRVAACASSALAWRSPGTAGLSSAPWGRRPRARALRTAIQYPAAPQQSEGFGRDP